MAVAPRLRSEPAKDRRGAAGPSDRGGFVLAVVVFLLFAISIAATTGYLVVTSEFAMARYSADGSEALTVARSGLERFVSEQIGSVADSTTYAMGNGFAVVTARRMFVRDSTTETWYVQSEGTVTDIRTPDAPARRVVGAYAVRHRAPLAEHAALTISSNQIHVDNGGNVRGQNAASPGDCWVGGASGIGGAIATTLVTEGIGSDVIGTPDTHIWPGGYAQILDSLGVRWDVLSDPDFPFEFDGTWPNFVGLPSDSFPLVRQWGWVSTSIQGRGVLVVPGTFDPESSFQWRGIVLAGQIDDYIQGDIDGIVVGGLNGPNMYSTVEIQADIEYDSCDVFRANGALSYLELIEESLGEVY